MQDSPPEAKTNDLTNNKTDTGPTKSSIFEIYFPARVLGEREEIYIASFPQIICFWPSILVFFTSALVQSVVGYESSALGWITIGVFLFNILVLVHDFDQKKFIVLVLGIVTMLLALWIFRLKGFLFFERLSSWLFGFEPMFSTSALFLLAGGLSGLFLLGLIGPFFNYWKIAHNEFVHYVQPLGRDVSIARSGCTVNKEVPDIFEYLLTGGGGTLVIKREKDVLASIPHVPFLGLRMGPIEEMLGETRVTVIEERR